jgi:hypothetical protein
MWWGAGAELLLTRTKDNARLAQVQRESYITATWEDFASQTTTRGLQVTRAGTTRGLPERLSYVPRENTGTHPQAVVLHHQTPRNTEGAAVPRPRKYHTDEERREAACRYERKYREANRKTINRRRAQAYKSKRAAIEAVQKGPSARSPQGELEDPRAAFLRGRDG